MFGQSALAFALLPEVAVLVAEHVREKENKAAMTEQEKSSVRLYAAIIAGGLALIVTADGIGLILAVPILIHYLHEFLPVGQLRSITERLKRPHLMLASQLALAYISEGMMWSARHSLANSLMLP